VFADFSFDFFFNAPSSQLPVAVPSHAARASCLQADWCNAVLLPMPAAWAALPPRDRRRTDEALGAWKPIVLHDVRLRSALGPVWVYPRYTATQTLRIETLGGMVASGRRTSTSTPHDILSVVSPHPHTPPLRVAVDPLQTGAVKPRARTAMKKLRIVILRFGTARQKRVLE
jgi:hypothetical protein